MDIIIISSYVTIFCHDIAKELLISIKQQSLSPGFV